MFQAFIFNEEGLSTIDSKLLKERLMMMSHEIIIPVALVVLYGQNFEVVIPESQKSRELPLDFPTVIDQITELSIQLNDIMIAILDPEDLEEEIEPVEGIRKIVQILNVLKENYSQLLLSANKPELKPIFNEEKPESAVLSKILIKILKCVEQTIRIFNSSFYVFFPTLAKDPFLDKVEKVKANQFIEEIIRNYINDVGDKAKNTIFIPGETNNEVDLEITNLEKMKLDFVLRNLIKNAIKFSDGKEVKVETGKIEGKNEWFISVIDKGVGIPIEVIPTIFNLKSRAEHSADREGFGIGLNIVKILMEELKGKVEMISQLEKGSCFTLILSIAFKKD